MSRNTRSRLCGVLAACGLGALAAASAPPARITTAPARTGTIEGRVALPGAPRRVAQRYIGAQAPSQTVQVVPPVVLVTTSPRARAGAGERVQLTQRDTAFRPGVVIVGIGATVEFPNQDPFFHNVFSYSAPKRFDLGRYPRGESRSVTFDEPGMVKVYCEVHDFMRSVVVVTQHTLHAVVGADGSFTITGVPPGRHTLLLWHPEHGSREVVVEVRDGATARVELGFS